MLIVKIEHFHFSCDDGPSVFADRNNVNVRQTASTFVISTFTLIGSSRATP